VIRFALCYFAGRLAGGFILAAMRRRRRRHFAREVAAAVGAGYAAAVHELAAARS
jgi:hypothetical protein